MITQWNVQPGIFRPLRLAVKKVYAGSVKLGRITAFAETGTIGPDEVASCAFGSSRQLQIREGPAIATKGSTYVAFLGTELIPGTTGAISQPIIADLIVIRGNKVVGYSNRLESFPL